MLKEDLGRIWNSLAWQNLGLENKYVRTCSQATTWPRFTAKRPCDMIVQKKKKRSQLFRIRDVRPYFTAADADSTR
jgi:hypothetical protein